MNINAITKKDICLFQMLNNIFAVKFVFSIGICKQRKCWGREHFVYIFPEKTPLLRAELTRDWN